MGAILALMLFKALLISNLRIEKHMYTTPNIAACVLGYCLAVPLGAHAMATFNPSSSLLTVQQVTVAKLGVYANVSAYVYSYSLQGVDNGTPQADTFDDATKLLTLGTVSVGNNVYNNVRVKINAMDLLSADKLTPSSNPLSKYVGVYSSCGGDMQRGTGSFAVLELTNTLNADGSLSISRRDIYYRNGNCQGDIVGIVSYSAPTIAVFQSTKRAKVIDGSNNWMQDFDQAIFSRERGVKTISGTGVSGLCITMTNYKVCEGSLITDSFTYSGGLYVVDSSNLYSQYSYHEVMDWGLTFMLVKVANK